MVVLLALPVLAIAYVAFFGRRGLSISRSMLAGVLGVTVIGSVYAEVAARQAVAPVRRAPLPLTLAAVLALALAGSGLRAAPARAASDQAEAVIAQAMSVLGSPYVWAAEGPARFDCSGLVYWAFRRAGELPLIGGTRTTAARYYKWFSTRGLTSRSEGRRGDLVIYGRGTHIGIYLGNGEVVSALNTKGKVVVHGLHALNTEFTTFLTVDWSMQPIKTTVFVSNVPGSGGQGDGKPADEEEAKGPATSDGNGGGGTDDQGEAQSMPEGIIARGYAFGSLNLRTDAAPGARIIGYVGRGATTDILEAGTSPSGALWYKVRKPSGKEGWIWSRWIRIVEGSVNTQ